MNENAFEKLDEINDRIFKLREDDQPIPKKLAMLRLEALMAITEDSKKRADIALRIEALEARQDESIGFTMEMLPDDVVKLIAGCKAKKIKPYAPKM